MGYITVVGVIYFLINLMIANIMQNVVRLKGYEEDKNAVALTLLFGMVGVMYVVALPDKKLNDSIENLIESINMLNKNNITNANHVMFDDKDRLPPL